jgi:hypothetical protein
MRATIAEAEQKVEELRKGQKRKIIDSHLLQYIIDQLGRIIQPNNYNSRETNIFEGVVASYINNPNGNENLRFDGLVIGLIKQSRKSLLEILETIKIHTDDVNSIKYSKTPDAKKFKKKVITKILRLLKIHILNDELKNLLTIAQVNLDSENKNIETAITTIKNVTLTSEYDKDTFQSILSEYGLTDSIEGLIITRFEDNASDETKKAILLNKVNSIIHPEKVPDPTAAASARSVGLDWG